MKIHSKDVKIVRTVTGEFSTIGTSAEIVRQASRKLVFWETGPRRGSVT